MNEFQRRSRAQKLRSEYHMKSRHLEELKGKVSIVKMEMCNNRDQECSSEIGIRSPSLEKSLGWREKLQQVTTHLQNVHLDDSQEHSYLKQLQRHVQLSVVNASPHDTELYDLVSLVADLNVIHENLCALKEEIENEINTALRALAKAHLHLTLDCGLSEDVDSTDNMTHFVNQHVSPNRRKVPFQDLTNTSFIHHSVDNDQSSTRPILLRDGGNSEVSTNPLLSQIETHTSGSKIQCRQNINDNDTGEVTCKSDDKKGLREMYKEKVLQLNTNCIHAIPNHYNEENEDSTGCAGGINKREAVRNSEDEDSTVCVRRINKYEAVRSNEDEKRTAAVKRIDKHEAIRSFHPCSKVDNTSNVSTGATIYPRFNNYIRVKACPEFNFGAECHYHGSSSGKIKLSHFSTPSKPACNKVRSSSHFDLQNLTCCSQKGLCCNRQGSPTRGSNRQGSPVRGTISSCGGPGRAMLENSQGIHAVTSKESATMTSEVGSIMNIPYIDE